MSEPTAGGFKDAATACIIVLFILMGMAYYVNHNQAQTINDLQRRVGQLEQKR